MAEDAKNRSLGTRNKILVGAGCSSLKMKEFARPKAMKWIKSHENVVEEEKSSTPAWA